jgi:sigma-B regulation protein RsbU (phosphoserine phosphatase)
LPLGIADNQNFDHACQKLHEGDLLLLYTDGVTEAFAAGTSANERELFGVERLDDVLLKNRGCSAEECIAKIRQGVAEFAGNNSPNDDQTLIAIRCV